jgi:hypothetical protein
MSQNALASKHTDLGPNPSCQQRCVVLFFRSTTPVLATWDICSRKMQIQSFLTTDIFDKSPDF